MTLGWGVIGAGAVAIDRMMPAIVASASSHLAAVNRTDPGRLRDVQLRFSAPRAYVQAADLVNDPGVDVVYVASPVVFHREHAVLAANAGKPILLEKPVGLNSEDVSAIMAACIDNGVFFDGALMMRHHRLHRRMRSAVQAGNIGTPLSVRLSFCFRYDAPPTAWRLIERISGGGAFMDLGPHLIDLVEYVLGHDTTHVAGIMDAVIHDASVEDSASVLLGLSNGCHALLSTHFNIPAMFSPARFEVCGTAGMLIADGTLGQTEDGILRITTVTHPDGQTILADQGDLYESQVNEFSAAVHDPNRWAPLMHHQAHLQRVIDSVYRSRTGQL